MNPPNPLPSRRSARRGFSLPEMLMVMVIAAISMRIALPKIAGMRDKSNLRTAKQAVMAEIANARAAAIRRSAVATFNLAGDSVYATTTISGTTANVRKPIRIDRTWNVTVRVSPGGGATDNIAFDPRGFATNLTGTRIYKFTRNSTTD